ncbi:MULTISPECIES: RNA polymerase sigma factor SigF [Streptomyces]|uniref:B/F/G family RNA polymerase sigma-70 factor n=1 Tax=Streptomyces violaceoruber TaxID=1935 RepID=A0A1V0UA63_STRVN|nr:MULTISPECIES: RNA polymerase sigma factor SigF [Streptomyces]MYW79304.1 SigB/SigF/SigG family RNA polymerase sigma factor [Streptomyces sp. SID8369]NEA13316.1 RNA polymerase sigma factor SigF [Streptomyces sp. SID10692]ARF62133.1 B/F/G family RNA polymerase sigma-70 factor [Streptomyces violaceoruber]KOG81436.1 RNA polymerase sigma factor [Streptomyces griseus subsp. rhodochrous]KOU06821.1 RNA polymerase sigma factor [Streptomyces sp. NRRL F-2295]
MSPRLDGARTHYASSACPQGPTNSDSPAASAVPGPRAGTPSTTSTTTDFSGVTGEELEGLEGLPEIPPYAEVGALDARALSKTLFERLETLDEGTHEYSYVRNTLVELNLALVKFAASRFRSRSEPMEDIVQVGTIGLIKAIDRFELSRGVEFPTFAMPTIIGEIKRFFRDTSWSVRVPRRLQELRLDLAKAGDELSQQLDRAPTVAELSERLGITPEEVVEGMTASNAYTASSLDAKPEDDEGEGALADRIGYEDNGLEGIEYVESLKPLIAALPARDRMILSLRFVSNMTQSEIGEELNISQMHVSRLLSRTLTKLRKGLTVEE